MQIGRKQFNYSRMLSICLMCLPPYNSKMMHNYQLGVAHLLWDEPQGCLAKNLGEYVSVWSRFSRWRLSWMEDNQSNLNRYKCCLKRPGQPVVLIVAVVAIQINQIGGNKTADESSVFLSCQVFPTQMAVVFRRLNSVINWREPLGSPIYTTSESFMSLVVRHSIIILCRLNGPWNVVGKKFKAHLEILCCNLIKSRRWRCKIRIDCICSFCRPGDALFVLDFSSSWAVARPLAGCLRVVIVVVSIVSGWRWTLHGAIWGTAWV